MSDITTAIRMEYPDTIPVSFYILPSAWFKYGSELQKLIDQYPQFFNGMQVDLAHLRENLPIRYRRGKHPDEWGCVWENEVEGADSMVKQHPIKCEEDIFSLKIPPNREGILEHGFMYLRLLDLCGFEDAMVYFAEEGEAIDTLIDKVLEYNIYQVAATLPRMKTMFSFGDDLGMQTGLAIGPERWRKYLKPCYRKLYGMVKAYDPSMLIYMHTDGCIYEIMPDLVECGVDMINPQFRANGLDNLVRVCREEQVIPINLDLDRQMFPFATRSQIFDHVRDCIEALYLPQGGLGINIEFDHGIPLENIAALLEAAEKYRHYKG
ncbi:MAG: hypothetical protein IKM04_00690 [Clostridia bacterium]|nr:hypothetical protein [Clostridia bacterium]